MDTTTVIRIPQQSQHRVHLLHQWGQNQRSQYWRTMENNNDGEGVPIKGKDIPLTKNWEECGRMQLEKVSDKKLVEYIMGNDIHISVCS